MPVPCTFVAMWRSENGSVGLGVSSHLCVSFRAQKPLYRISPPEGRLRPRSLRSHCRWHCSSDHRIEWQPLSLRLTRSKHRLCALEASRGHHMGGVFFGGFKAFLQPFNCVLLRFLLQVLGCLCFQLLLWLSTTR